VPDETELLYSVINELRILPGAGVYLNEFAA
jgi:hypothetical protein